MAAHPNVWGFFAPQGGDLDLTAYDRQLSAGQRVQLTPEQAVRLANNRVASTIYNNAKDSVAPTNLGQRQALQALQDALGQKYPGYGDNSGIPQKASTQTIIRDLQTAAIDPRLAGNPATEPLQTYLEARQIASDRAVSAGLSPSGFQSATSMAATRNLLRALGEALAQRYPEFAPMWDQAFSRELKDDSTLTAAAQAADPQLVGA